MKYSDTIVSNSMQCSLCKCESGRYFQKCDSCHDLVCGKCVVCCSGDVFGSHPDMRHEGSHPDAHESGKQPRFCLRCVVSEKKGILCGNCGVAPWSPHGLQCWICPTCVSNGVETCGDAEGCGDCPMG